MNISYKKRFPMFSESLSDPELVNYARKNGNNTFSRKRKMPLKDMLLCCFSKKGLTTAFELRNYFKDKGELSMQLSVQGYLQQRKRLNPEIFPYLNRKYLMDFYLDIEVEHISVSENELAKRNIKHLKEMGTRQPVPAISDRGYPSIEFIDFLET